MRIIPIKSCVQSLIIIFRLLIIFSHVINKIILIKPIICFQKTINWFIINSTRLDPFLSIIVMQIRLLDYLRIDFHLTCRIVIQDIWFTFLFNPLFWYSWDDTGCHNQEFCCFNWREKKCRFPLRYRHIDHATSLIY